MCRASNNITAFGVLMSLNTGIRIGELLGLTWKNVDFEDGSIYIEQAVARRKDFDAEEGANKTRVEILPTKTTNSTRTVPMSDELIKELLEYRDKQEFLHGRLPEYVISNNLGGIMEPRNYTRFFYILVKRAGLGHKNYHTTRHTFATRWMQRGLDVLTLSKILGHAHTSTTQNRYGHVLEEHKKSKMKVMGQYHV